MNKILTICFFIFTSSGGFTQDLNKIIGKTFRNIEELSEFSEYSDGGGAVIQDDYVIKILLKADERLIILTRIVLVDGKAHYTALDSFSEQVDAGKEFITYQTCRSNRKTDDRIIAKVVSEENEYYDKVLKAWIVNMELLKMEPISVEKIDCLNDGWGI